MRYLTFLARLFFALFLVAVAALYLVRYQPWFKKRVQQKVQNFFLRQYSARITGEVQEVTFFSPSIVMDNVRVSPCDDPTSWAWEADHGSIGFSLLDLVRTGSMNIQVSLNSLKAVSRVEGTQVAIAPHLQKLFLPPDLGIPVVFKGLTVAAGDLSFFEQDSRTKVHLALRVDVNRVNRRLNIAARVMDAEVHKNEACLMRNGSGDLAVELGQGPAGFGGDATTTLQFNLPHLGAEKSCVLNGHWGQSGARVVLASSDKALSVEGTLDESRIMRCHGTAPFFLAHQLLPLAFDGAASGACSFDLKAQRENILPTMRADIQLRDLRYKGVEVARGTIVAQGSPAGLDGSLAVEGNHGVAFDGTWRWREKTGCTLSAHTSKKIELPRAVVIPPRGFGVRATVDRAGNVRATYDMALKREADVVLTVTGVVEKKGDRCSAWGSLGQDSYNLELLLHPLTLNRFEYRNKKGLLAQSSSSAAAPLHFEGVVDYALFEAFLSDELKKELRGNGQLHFSAQRTDSGVEGSLKVKGASIRVPRLYNFVGSFDTDFVFDAHERNLVFNNVVCGLHRGLVQSPKVSVRFDESYRVASVHAPVVLESCFVSWQKDLFATVSGDLLACYAAGSPTSLSGTIFVDRSQLKGNIFSHDLQRSMLLMPDATIAPKTDDLIFDLNVLTREPLRVKTSFIDARATFDVTIKKSLAAPEVAGKIELLEGELKFPYKSLSIVNGVMYLLPQQLYDPLIELTAKNKIKKYGITMFVTGSLQNPHIHFESSPTLTEEQIIALLLTGAQDSSLAVLMPALVVQNISQVLFGPAKSSSTLQRYFKSLLKPLSHVRIVPSFADEMGRGGLRAAIEVEVNDQLSATIEKNFSLSEDTKFEIDYALTDDISVKGVKDERGDFGGEVEVKWKF